MAIWIIEPHDPLIARDGRPFGNVPGARAASLPFPFPSTMAGGVRTRAGWQNGAFRANPADVQKIGVRGPLLAEIEDGQKADEAIFRLLAPAPLDALLLNLDPLQEGRARCKQLVPQATPSGALTDFEAHRPSNDFAFLGFAVPEKAQTKPYSGAPRFWGWDRFTRWLEAPCGEEEVAVSEVGHGGPESDARSHVSIDASTLTNREGALFQTRGLDFSRRAANTTCGGKYHRLGLVVAVDDALPDGLSIAPGMAPLGGERRLVRWRRGANALPECPASLRAAIVRDGQCRVVLLTPAYFAAGWRPDWLLQTREGVTPALCAAAVGRAQIVSGWDVAFKQERANGTMQHGQPKATRRLTPAGSVYFLCLDTAPDAAPDALEHWIRATWMKCVSDDLQDRRDGFGLAALGIWKGEAA